MRILVAVIFILPFLLSCADSENKIERNPDLTEIPSPVTDSCAEPYLFTDKNGRVLLSWIERRNGVSLLRFSSYKEDKWSEPITIASGKNWFVNWADYPVLVSDGNGKMFAHYLEKSDSAKFTYDIKLVNSLDNGKSWSQPVTLNEDGKKAEHGFVSMQAGDDMFFMSWLDGRKTAMEGNMENHEGHHGEMTLRGARFDVNGNKTNDWELDGRACDCCQTCIAMTATGPIVVYRDRSEEEIRDISIVRHINGEWTSPQTVFADQWKIAGCPVNGPRADAIGDHLVIAWFSMPENSAQVNIIFSKDAGATFDQPVRIDEGKAIGRVDVLMLDSSTALVSWMEGVAIKAVKVHSDGTKGNPVMIASSSESRSSGFPQMTRQGNKIIFAWTDDKAKTIRLASMEL